VTFSGRAGAKAATSIVVLMAAVAIGLFIFRTQPGAGVIAMVRCSASWLTTDRATYRACYDFEREQVIENRAKRETRFDE
jgi:hypothetical protein